MFSSAKVSAERTISVYPAASLTGIGTIDGQSVRCISAEWLVKFHSGYALDENDIKDVRRLCERFGIEQLPEHKNWSP
jgi:lincosamide nucleotidyltransferase A/C/D/E